MGKRGISLITLAVTLAIMMLITGAVVISGLNSIETARKSSFGIEIKNIQEVVDEYISKTGEDVPITKTIILDTTGLTPGVKDAQFSSEDISLNKLQLDVIDLFKLGIKDVKYGRGETDLDYYAISNITKKVYYPAGVRVGDEVYYTLTDELNQIIGKNDVLDTNRKSIVFEGGPSKWTNIAAQINVKVPEEYTGVSVTTTDDVSVPPTPTNVDEYNEYTLNTEYIKTVNYTVTVLYTDPNSVGSKTAVYKVNKIDAEGPVIDTGAIEQKYNIDSATNIATAYITNISATDGLSGIKSVKYVKGTVSSPVVLKDFFDQYGKDVANNKIQIEKGATSYTIYAEDNAGNVIAINVAIDEYIQSILW